MNKGLDNDVVVQIIKILEANGCTCRDVESLTPRVESLLLDQKIAWVEEDTQQK